MGDDCDCGLRKTLSTERLSGQIHGDDPLRLVEIDEPLMLCTMGNVGRRGEKKPRLQQRNIERGETSPSNSFLSL